jgi:hypothetical protein
MIGNPRNPPMRMICSRPDARGDKANPGIILTIGTTEPEIADSFNFLFQISAWLIMK